MRVVDERDVFERYTFSMDDKIKIRSDHLLLFEPVDCYRTLAKQEKSRNNSIYPPADSG